MLLVGYLASGLIGVTLGLVGAGGSILTVPVLVYLFAIPATVATTDSLFIVGVTALIGMMQYAREGSIEYRVAAIFGVPSALGVFLSRGLLVPALPDSLGYLWGVHLERDKLLLLLFAVLMVGAAYGMIRPKAESEPKPIDRATYTAKLGFTGVLVGFVMGLVGAGGGFLIIPALVLRARLPMRNAVGTSLLIIAVNSLLGFAGAATKQAVDWGLLSAVSAIAVAGILAGSRLAQRVSGSRLKPAFGVFVLVMGAFIIGQELIR